ncbi:MAG: pyrimidine dimer DNA glycosylase/endonuclease V [Nanoarchaeota archaeon]|nr:pyrimidine dimer DNA glycosylase/endonuclease V [Nanoarchaeota archaeon]
MTRMWMVNPKKICKNHLLGEHKELHQLIGSLNKNKSVKGHINRGQVEIHNIKKRHEQLVKEMLARGYRHLSPLPKFKNFKAGKISISQNEKELSKRCKDCRRLLK